MRSSCLSLGEDLLDVLVELPHLIDRTDLDEHHGLVGGGGCPAGQ